MSRPLDREQNLGSSNISRPIQYYNKDSLTFNCEKPQLYAEIHNASSPQLPPRPPRARGQRRLLLLLTPTALLSLTSTILYAAVIPIWERNFEHTKFPLKGDWTDGFILLPLSISFLSSTYLIYSILRKRRQNARNHFDPHPSFASSSKSRSSPPVQGPDTFSLVLISLTVIITLIPLLILASTNSLAQAFRAGPPTARTQSGTVVCTVSNMLTRACVPILYRIGELQIGGAITAGLCSSLWIVILIFSIQLHRKAKKEAKRRQQERRQRREARRKARHELRELEKQHNTPTSHRAPRPAGHSNGNQASSDSPLHPHDSGAARPERADILTPLQIPQRMQQSSNLQPQVDRDRWLDHRTSQQIIGASKPGTRFYASYAAHEEQPPHSADHALAHKRHVSQVMRTEDRPQQSIQTWMSQRN